MTSTPLFSDFTNGKQLPTENSCRSFHFNSSANKVEVEQDLKGEVCVVDLPPESGNKETPAQVEPEQRAHANNTNGEQSSVHLAPEEQLRDPYNDLRVQATDTRKGSSVQDPADHLRDQDDDFSVHRRSNDGGPLAETPGGETDDERLQDTRSGDGSHQGQGN